MKTVHRTASHAKRRYKADPLSIYKLMSKLQPFTPDELVKLELPIRISYESMKSGKGTLSDYEDLALAVNVALVRAESISPLAEAMVLKACYALLRVSDRFKRIGHWGFDGQAIDEVLCAVEFHEELLRNSTPQQMIDAIREVRHRIELEEVEV